MRVVPVIMSRWGIVTRHIYALMQSQDGNEDSDYGYPLRCALRDLDLGHYTKSTSSLRALRDVQKSDAPYHCSSAPISSAAAILLHWRL
jgi:hypothetical protein